jgi:hypothetical protein
MSVCLPVSWSSYICLKIFIFLPVSKVISMNWVAPLIVQELDSWCERSESHQRVWQLLGEIKELGSCWERSESWTAAVRDQRAWQLLWGTTEIWTAAVRDQRAWQLLWDQRARVQELLGLENAVGDRCSWDVELCCESFCSERCVYFGYIFGCLGIWVCLSDLLLMRLIMAPCHTQIGKMWPGSCCCSSKETKLLWGTWCPSKYTEVELFAACWCPD